MKMSNKLIKSSPEEIADFVMKTQTVEIQHWISGAILDYSKGEMELETFSKLSEEERKTHVCNAIKAATKYECIYTDIIQNHLKY